MPTYNYRCSGCGKNYLEHRSVGEPRTFTKCECNGDYIEVTE